MALFEIVMELLGSESYDDCDYSDIHVDSDDEFDDVGDITFWSSSAEMNRIKAGFLANSGGKGPRNAIGCINGSHIQILTPSESTYSYFNRKKWSSIILQRICDDRNRFLIVFIGFPGFVRDARVLKESPFFTRAALECGENYILGDSAYPLMPSLMSPIRDNEASFLSRKKQFNERHSQQRVSIENTFGVLKQRLRRLYLVDAKSVVQSCYIVMAACVLHNLCNNERDSSRS
ncbi:putative nuclease HARBI1 [Dermacentor andersoni]|uniref:putative nuclease HARBI1 n=1 Tax=Dermacentor andersoni TaxID=34620 RepID=UPI003B3BE076